MLVCYVSNKLMLEDLSLQGLVGLDLVFKSSSPVFVRVLLLVIEVRFLVKNRQRSTVPSRGVGRIGAAAPGNQEKLPRLDLYLLVHLLVPVMRESKTEIRIHVISSARPPEIEDFDRLFLLVLLVL